MSSTPALEQPLATLDPLDQPKLQRIIQAMVDAVLVFNPQGEILLCNATFEKTFGLTQSTTARKTLYEVFEHLAPELSDILLQAAQSGQAASQEYTVTQNRPPQTFLLYTIPITENSCVTEGVAVFHDITQVKQTEKMRRDFVANVSHELRTPLSAINGYAETLLEGAFEDPAVAKDFIQIIFNHSQRLSQLVRDLLDLSKLESSEEPFELHPIDFIPIVEKAIQLSQKHLTEKQITCHFVPPTDFPKVLAHEGNIEQVITNLLDNAIKYTPQEGAIEIRMLVRADGFAQIDVKDTGIGIESKHINRVFERFYRVDKARSRDLGGTGLGLAIVKHIVQSHGGEVWVSSLPGVGSTFSFTLKRTDC